MKCNSCGSEWKTDNRTSVKTDCPFCGTSLAKEETPKMFDNIKDTLHFIASSTFTVSNRQVDGRVMLLSKSIVSIFSDMAPTLKDEKDLIRIIQEKGALMILRGVMKASSAEQEIAIKRAVLKFPAFMDKEAITSILYEFADALGWQLPDPQKGKKRASQKSKPDPRQKPSTLSSDLISPLHNPPKWPKITGLATVALVAISFLVFLFGDGIFKKLENTPDGTIDTTSPLANITVSFEAGEETSSIDSIVRMIDSQYSNIPQPVRYGYHFNGWYTNSDLIGTPVTTSTIVPSIDHTLYAKWMPVTVTVSFVSFDSMIPFESRIVIYDSIYGEFPKPEPRPGYAFVGWATEDGGGVKYTNGSGSLITVSIASDHTLYAKWALIKYDDSTAQYENDNDTEQIAAIPSVPTNAPIPSTIPESVVKYITIKGVQYSTALTVLDLSNMNLYNEDIADLKYMTNLEYLLLPNNQINDITILSSLTKLDTLILDGNGINNLSSLSGLISLKSLLLSGNQISNIAPLSNLKNLESLNLSYNQISDITSLIHLESLVALVLDANQISDITPLSVLMHLEYLMLSDNEITDWSPVNHMEYVGGRP